MSPPHGPMSIGGVIRLRRSVADESTGWGSARQQIDVFGDLITRTVLNQRLTFGTGTWHIRSVAENSDCCRNSHQPSCLLYRTQPERGSARRSNGVGPARSVASGYRPAPPIVQR